MNAPVSRVSNQSAENWQTIREIIRSPGQFSSNHDISEIIERLDKMLDSVSVLEQRSKERRQALWVLVIVLFVQGWDTPENRQEVLNIMNEWKVDQVIFYEMKDTAETYRVITSENDKRDLDKSITDLIEIG